MVTGFPARVLEMIDSLIARDKLDSGDLKLIRDKPLLLTSNVAEPHSLLATNTSLKYLAEKDTWSLRVPVQLTGIVTLLVFIVE